MALDTSGFVPKGNLNTDEDALSKSGRKGTIKKVLKRLSGFTPLIVLSILFKIINSLTDDGFIVFGQIAVLPFLLDFNS